MEYSDNSSQAKEDLSISFICALCANAGIDYEICRHDQDSTDGIIKKIVFLGNGEPYLSSVRVQLKSTNSKSQYDIDNKNVHYRLKAKNYNDMCMRSLTKVILCLLILPEDDKDWIKVSSDELIIRGCMYWRDFDGCSPTDNKSTINIEIDKNNIVTSDVLKNILINIAKEETECE